MTCYNGYCSNVVNSACIGFDCQEWEKCPKFDGKRPKIDVPYAVDSESDPVNHPSHYQGKYECIDIMKAMFGEYELKVFCKLNAFKYRFRAGKKDGSSMEEDVAKAEWYENKYMELHEECLRALGK